MRPLIVLAGGFGTRLRSLVKDIPKPLAPAAGKPFIIYLIENWVQQGVRDFIFLLHFKSDLIVSILLDLEKDGNFSDIKINIIIEKKPLGTGGSIYNAVNTLNIKESFLVANADTWLSSGISQLNSSSCNTIGAVKVNDCSRYGALDIKNTHIQNFLEKDKSSEPGLINAGLYHLSPDIFLGLPLLSNFSIESKVFPLLVKKKALKAEILDVDFIDIGIPEDYLKFCRYVELGESLGV